MELQTLFPAGRILVLVHVLPDVGMVVIKTRMAWSAVVTGVVTRAHAQILRLVRLIQIPSPVWIIVRVLLQPVRLTWDREDWDQVGRKGLLLRVLTLMTGVRIVKAGRAVRRLVRGYSLTVRPVMTGALAIMRRLITHQPKYPRLCTIVWDPRTPLIA